MGTNVGKGATDTEEGEDEYAIDCACTGFGECASTIQPKRKLVTLVNAIQRCNPNLNSFTVSRFPLPIDQDLAICSDGDDAALLKRAQKTLYFLHLLLRLRDLAACLIQLLFVLLFAGLILLLTRLVL